MFNSLVWGTDWETVQNNEDFQSAECKISENGRRQTVVIENMEFLGTDILTVGLVFDVADATETNGLNSVFLQFEEDDEELLLTKLTELYGERKDSYLDKNGVENGISPAGWVSSETIEDVLTDDEKEYYIGLFPQEYVQSRKDAILRSLLVTIRFDEERNLIEFNGNAASVVTFVKAQLQK